MLDELWHRLGIARALHKVATGRRLDGEIVERILFALVAQRCLEPASKLACVSWVRERVALSSCPPFEDQAAYAATDFLLDALGEIATGIFDRTANLLNLSCDVVFVDTSSTYWEVDAADEEIDLATARAASEEKEQEVSPTKALQCPTRRRFASSPSTQRITGKTFPRWWLPWPSPRRGSRSAAGPSRAGPRTSSSSDGSRTTSGPGC
ncbi:MAG: hypothetical protein M0Z46_13300 [Actinomycetota bacterium]|nr:hypothetical protein [Actinomycetota bacterium]